MLTFRDVFKKHVCPRRSSTCQCGHSGCSGWTESVSCLPEKRTWSLQYRENLPLTAQSGSALAETVYSLERTQNAQFKIPHREREC